MAEIDTTRKAGTTTYASTSGSAAAGAGAVVLIWIVSLFGVTMPSEVAGAVVVLFGAAGAYIAGWRSPSKASEAVAAATVAAEALAPRIAEHVSAAVVEATAAAVTAETVQAGSAVTDDDDEEITPEAMTVTGL